MVGAVLLTGATGMLGRSLVDAFAELAPEKDLLTPSRAELDLASARSVRSYLDAHRCDAIVHAAARVGGIQANISEPTEFLLGNIQINSNLATAAIERRVPVLLNIGSSCMYPRDYAQPLLEEYLLAAPLEPTNEGYALSKIVMAKACEYVAREHGLAWRTVIPSNLYGQYDHFDTSKGHLVASAIAKVHAAKQSGSQTVEVWGDGTARREFTFVADVARWVVAVLDRVADLPSVLNVGLGTDYSVREYYEIVSQVVGFRGVLTFNTTKAVGMHQKLLDSSLAKTHGWAPETSVQEGVAKAYAFFLENRVAQA